MPEKKDNKTMEQEKKELEERLNARVRYRTCQEGFNNDAPPHNFFPTPKQYHEFVNEGKDKGIFIFYKEKGYLGIQLIVAYPLSIIKEIIQLESKKVDDFEKYKKSCILPLISEHRLGASLKKKNQNRPFYIDLEKLMTEHSKYCFEDEADLLKNYDRIF